MTYITRRQDGAPEWTQPAIKCKVWDICKSSSVTRYIIGTLTYENKLRYVDDEGDEWRYAEPVEAWRPQEGEIVAGWGVVDSVITIGKLRKDLCDRLYLGSPSASFMVYHVARLVYPDDRVIDCACDVETLKRRCGEGNWI